MMEQSTQPLARLESLDPALIEPDSIELAEESLSIGRSASCGLMVRHALVSRQHALIERRGPRYTIVDTGSANGTYINGRRISEPHLLSHDDAIGLGAPAPLLRFADPDPTLIRLGQLRYDERAMIFMLGNQTLTLTPFQFRLLLHLYRHAGDLCSRESCAQAVWDRAYDPATDTNMLDQAVAGVRRAIRLIDPSADMLETRRGIGFILMV
jgi:DNA-binding response OmpR family regulator